MRIPIGYKFILGFMIVVAAAAFIPDVVDDLDIYEWLRKPVSFLAAILIGLVLGSVFTKGITRHFKRITGMARRISEGDLTGSDYAGRGKFFDDEMSDLESAVRSMSMSLRGLVESLKQTIENLTEALKVYGAVAQRGQETSQELSAGATSIFDGALMQSNHIGDASAAVKSMAALADEMAGKVNDNANASQKVNSMVQRGATAATSAIEKMETMFKGVENTEAAAERLKEKINDIPKILDVITHISRQTDLLALNATIEASKAGEHGRGFAMVAEEVRRFADNTNNSVQDVSLIVKELKLDVERAVLSASEGVAYLKGGREDLRKIREILVDITNYTAGVAEMGAVILELTHKQKEKADKTVDIIGEVAGIAHENLTSTEKVESALSRHETAINETLEASRKLAELSEELRVVATRFYL